MANADDTPAVDAIGELVSLALPMPGVELGTRHLLDRVVAEWKRNRSRALAAAVQTSGMSREDFAEWATAQPQAVPLLLKVLWAAGSNGHDETLRAMGVVLGRAARATASAEPDAFEEAELALRAMENLTPKQHQVLALLSQSHVIGTPPNINYQQFAPYSVAERLGWSENVTLQCMINLAAAGLVTQLSVMGGFAYPITAMGQAVVDAAQLTS